MNNAAYLDRMEQFFMALADKTRLRLLNLMRGKEVCVCFFTEVLGESQPKISRHLAYLRNAGIVEARRDGKWMHYSIVWPDDAGERKTLESAMEWLGGRDELQLELERYETVCCTPELLVQIARTPIDFLDIGPGVKVIDNNTALRMTRSESEKDVSRAQKYSEVQSPSHNELEEFLL